MIARVHRGESEPFGRAAHSSLRVARQLSSSPTQLAAPTNRIDICSWRNATRSKQEGSGTVGWKNAHLDRPSGSTGSRACHFASRKDSVAQHHAIAVASVGQLHLALLQVGFEI
jgi:hypothetical protein